MYSTRGNDFLKFSLTVADHIDNYTVPQYGDSPNDEVAQWTPEQCVYAIAKYCKRFESNRRGRLEQLRDMVKIAHFAQLVFDKLEPTIAEKTIIENGGDSNGANSKV